MTQWSVGLCLLHRLLELMGISLTPEKPFFKVTRWDAEIALPYVDAWPIQLGVRRLSRLHWLKFPSWCSKAALFSPLKSCCRELALYFCRWTPTKHLPLCLSFARRVSTSWLAYYPTWSLATWLFPGPLINCVPYCSWRSHVQLHYCPSYITRWRHGPKSTLFPLILV